VLAAGAATTLVPVSVAESLQVREPHRPHSADAAERCGASCTANLPRSADAATRVAEACWSSVGAVGGCTAYSERP